MDVEFAYGYYYVTNYKIFKQKGYYVLKNPISGQHLCSIKPGIDECATPSLIDITGNSVIYEHRDKIFYCACLINKKHPDAGNEDYILKYYENNYNRSLLRQLANSAREVFKRNWDFESPCVLFSDIDSHCWFILDQRIPIGYVAVKVYGEKAHLYSIYILPPFQKKGHGTQAIKYVIETIINEGIAEKIRLIDPTDVTIKILMKLGYVIKVKERYKIVNKKLAFFGCRGGLLPSPRVRENILKNPLGWDKKHFEDVKL